MKNKYRGRFKLITDLTYILTKRRIIIDGDLIRLIKNIGDKKYQDNKYYYLDEEV